MSGHSRRGFHAHPRIVLPFLLYSLVGARVAQLSRGPRTLRKGVLTHAAARPSRAIRSVSSSARRSRKAGAHWHPLGCYRVILPERWRTVASLRLLALRHSALPLVRCYPFPSPLERASRGCVGRKAAGYAPKSWRNLVHARMIALNQALIFTPPHPTPPAAPLPLARGRGRGMRTSRALARFSPGVGFPGVCSVADGGAGTVASSCYTGLGTLEKLGFQRSKTKAMRFRTGMDRASFGWWGDAEGGVMRGEA
jgi:hypothetical protein